MVKKFMTMAAGVALLFGLSGCASQYVMTTKTGQAIVTHGKPELDKETGMTRYTDEDGNEHQINSADVAELVEK